MLQSPDRSRNPSYLVPCVVKAVQLIEVLRETRRGLRVEDLRRMTGFSTTTIYRILRTLAACGYILRDSPGFYRLNYVAVPTSGQSSRHGWRDHPSEIPPQRSGTRALGSATWDSRFCYDGAKRNSSYSTTRATAPRTGDR